MEKAMVNEVFNVIKKTNLEDVTKMKIRISEREVKISYKKKNKLFKTFVEKVKKFFEKINANIYVLDTCALRNNEAMKIIDNAKKVVLTNGVICEMDKYKKAKGSFGNNISRILKQSAIDQKQEKFVCVQEETISNYNDDNLINYCKKIRRKAILLTADNDLANKAKAQKIKYIHFENTKEKNENQLNQANEKTTLNESQDDNEITTLYNEIEEETEETFKIPEELKQLIIKNKENWILRARNTPYVREIVIRDEQLLAKDVKKYNTEQIELEAGDLIYKIVKESNKNIIVYTFGVNELTGIEKIEEISLRTINELYREIKIDDLAEIIKNFMTAQYN